MRPLRVKGGHEVEGLLDLVEDALSTGDGLAAARPVGVASHSRPLRARRAREHPAQAVNEALGGLDRGSWWLPSVEESLLVLARYASSLPYHQPRGTPCG